MKTKASILHIQKALRSDFNNLQTWLSDNKLLLNKNLLYALWPETEHQLKSNLLHVTHNDAGALQKTGEKMKYLCVWVDSELTFQPHIDHFVKVSFGAGALHCSTLFFSFYSLLKCFNPDLLHLNGTYYDLQLAALSFSNIM